MALEWVLSLVLLNVPVRVVYPSDVHYHTIDRICDSQGMPHAQDSVFGCGEKARGEVLGDFYYPIHMGIIVV